MGGGEGWWIGVVGVVVGVVVGLWERRLARREVMRVEERAGEVRFGGTGFWRLGGGGGELRRVGVRELGGVMGRLPVLRARRWARRELMRGTAVSSLMGEEPFKVGLRESRVMVVSSSG